MPPQIMTGATHLQTEKQHMCTCIHVEGNPCHDSMLRGAASMEMCKTCLIKRMYKKAMTRATTKPLQTRKRDSVYMCTYLAMYLYINTARACVHTLTQAAHTRPQLGLRGPTV